MTEDNLKDFTVNWVIGGLLLFSLLSFAISFMYNNNTSGLDDGTGKVFNYSYYNTSSSLQEVQGDSNSLLNITANTNPEVSDLGSRDSVSTAFGTRQSATSTWENSKRIMSWVFSGDSGKIIMGVVGGLLVFLSMFYIWRFIRQGS